MKKNKNRPYKISISPKKSAVIADFRASYKEKEGKKMNKATYFITCSIMGENIAKITTANICGKTREYYLEKVNGLVFNVDTPAGVFRFGVRKDGSHYKIDELTSGALVISSAYRETKKDFLARAYHMIHKNANAVKMTLEGSDDINAAVIPSDYFAIWSARNTERSA